MASHPATKRRRARRISEKYRVHMGELARLYVEANEVPAETARRAQAAGYGSVRGTHFRRWMEDPEFAAYVKAERERQANEARTEPAVRGPDKIAWLCSVDARLREMHEASGDEDDKLKLLKAIHSNGSEIRAEERHYEDLKDRESRRDFGLFLKSFVRWCQAQHRGTFRVLRPILQHALRDLDRIVAGIEGTPT